MSTGGPAEILSAWLRRVLALPPPAALCSHLSPAFWLTLGWHFLFQRLPWLPAPVNFNWTPQPCVSVLLSLPAVFLILPLTPSSCAVDVLHAVWPLGLLGGKDGPESPRGLGSGLVLICSSSLPEPRSGSRTHPLPDWRALCPVGLFQAAWMEKRLLVLRPALWASSESKQGLSYWLYFIDFCFSKHGVFLLGDAFHKPRHMPQPEACWCSHSRADAE